MKQIVIFLLSLTLIAFSSGCANAGAQASKPADGLSSLPDGYTEITCKAKEINGNEITVVPGGDTGSESSPSGFRQKGGQSPDFPEVGDETAAEDVLTDREEVSGKRSIPEGDIPVRGEGDAAANSTGGFWGQGGNGQMTGGSAGGTQNAADSMTFDGEETIYTIPVTASVTTGQGDNVRTISFTQIAVKSILKLTINEKGNISAVQVLQ